jgi:hypothetical protein
MKSACNWPTLRASAITVALALAFAQTAFAANALATKPDALLQIDLNRVSVVEKIVENWKGELPAAQISSFRSKLSALRADQLLAANLSGSFDGVLEIVNKQELSLQAVQALPSAAQGLPTKTLDQSKALGDLSADLVYTPITPCRLIDTRGVFSPVFAGGAYAPSETRTYQTSGNCGIPAGAQGVVTQIIMINPSAPGDIELLPQGAPFGSTVVMVFQGNTFSSVSTVAKLNPANGQFSTQIRGPGGHVAMDMTGYFKAPGGIIGDITDIQTAAGSGLTGGSASGVASLSLAPSFKLPQGCAANQIPKWDGAAWTCSADATGGGATNAWTQGGNAFGAPGVLGTTDAQNLTVQSGGGQASFLIAGNNGLRIERASAIPSNNAPNVTNGSANNVAGSPSVTSATVAGGGSGGNCVTPSISGRPCANLATSNGATVSGGIANAASGFDSTVVGGRFNIASSGFASVLGGQDNTASGGGATVVGGLSNTASGLASFAAGQGAKTQSSAATPVVFDGAFVWSDSNSGGATQNFHAAANDEFAVRARGGVRLVTGVDSAGLPLSTFSIEAATGNVNAPNIVTAQGKFAVPNNFPGGINTKQVGDRFRDNSIVAWARIVANGTINTIGRFGMTSVTRTGVGAYRVVIDVSLNSPSSVLPVVTPEIDTRPINASQIRVASVNQGVANNAFDVWINDGTGAPADNDFMLIVTGR